VKIALSPVLILVALGCSGSSDDPRPSKIAFAVDRAGTAREILVVDPKGGEPTSVAHAESYDETPAWSPDGLTLLFASGRSGYYGIYAWDGKLEKVCVAHYRDCGPSWSPDGRRIVYMSNRDDSWELYSISPAGRDEHRLTEHKASDTWPAWSPDGNSILFLSDRGGQQDIYVMTVLAAERQPPKEPDPKAPKPKEPEPPPKYVEDPKPLTNDRAWDGRPAWSPDGKRIAWPSAREGKAAIFVMDADGKNPRRLTPTDSEADEPSWSPDGKQLVFVSTRDGFRELYIQDVDVKNAKARRLTFQRGLVHTPAWSPALSTAK
jgi:TolB protein